MKYAAMLGGGSNTALKPLRFSLSKGTMGIF